MIFVFHLSTSSPNIVTGKVRIYNCPQLTGVQQWGSIGWQHKSRVSGTQSQGLLG